MNKKMRARKRRQARRVALTLVLMLTVALVSIGGTLAWLTAETDPVTNTFTVGDINIDLTESENLDLQIIPGKTITKDPVVTVEAGSEACWLFVKIDKANWDEKLIYNLAAGWTALNGETGVYYRTVDEIAAGGTAATFSVLSDNQVVVSDNLTKSEVQAMETAQPTLTFTAYAIQQESFDTAAAAWTQIEKESFNTNGENIPTPTATPAA